MGFKAPNLAPPRPLRVTCRGAQLGFKCGQMSSGSIPDRSTKCPKYVKIRSQLDPRSIPIDPRSKNPRPLVSPNFALVSQEGVWNQGGESVWWGIGGCLGFLVSWLLSFLVAWFEVSWFLGCLVSWFLGFKVPKFQKPLVFVGRYRSYVIKFPFHVFRKILITSSMFSKTN